MTNTPSTTIPDHLLKDRYWAPLIYIFSTCDKLNRYFNPQYINFKTGNVRAAALKKIAAPWSESERFMLQLALHCFSESNKVNLGDMDYLDSRNLQIAFQALKLRYGRGTQ